MKVDALVDLLQELQNRLGRYLVGDLDLMTLYAWLGDPIQAIEDSRHQELIDRVWFLIDDVLAEE